MNPIAQVQADEIGPIIAALLICMVPIIAILTAHQRKMAEIIHRNQIPSGQTDENAALRAEISRLTQAVHQNTIAIDNLAQRQLSPPPGPILASDDSPRLTR
ncbi:MAG TPA: hypothetical protein PLX06_05395 [Fimbriimonadaceae bacterium]|nr:hypothetical protein [Fimbriimonadaceae bacterium]